jgi:hypothetical protein
MSDISIEIHKKVTPLGSGVVVNNVMLFLQVLSSNPHSGKLFLPHFDGMLAVGLHVGSWLVYDIFLGAYVVIKPTCNRECLATLATFMTFLYFVTKL